MVQWGFFEKIPLLQDRVYLLPSIPFPLFREKRGSEIKPCCSEVQQPGFPVYYKEVALIAHPVVADSFVK
jgi:hypothetical protein